MIYSFRSAIAHWPERFQIGQRVEVEPDVEVVMADPNGRLVLGDCCRIGSGVRFVLGDRCAFGDYCTLHERTLVMARGPLRAGHNVWCGRNVTLDATGGLTVGHGVRIGAASQVWSHVEAGEELEGCTLTARRPTVLQDGVWLVGRVDVNPGVEIAARVAVSNGSVVTRSLTESQRLYAGAPATLRDRIIYVERSLAARWAMMADWMREFCEPPGRSFALQAGTATIETPEAVIVLLPHHPLQFDSRYDRRPTTYLNVETKTYTKQLTDLEVAFLRWLDGRRARFIPKENPT